MPVTVVLAIGVDSSHLANQNSAWQRAGYVATSAGELCEAMFHLRGGESNSQLPGPSIPAASRESDLVDSSIDARISVAGISNSPSGWNSFADETINNQAADLLRELTIR